MDGPPESQLDGQLDAPALLHRLRARPAAELEATFRDLDALHNATDAHRMLVLAVLDERDVGREDGALDTTGWVTWTARVSRARARGLWRPPARCRSVPRSQWSRSKAGCPASSMAQAQPQAR